MDWQRVEDDRQLELTDKLEAPLTSAERQRRYRAEQRKLGRRPRTLYLTDAELEAVEMALAVIR